MYRSSPPAFNVGRVTGWLLGLTVLVHLVREFGPSEWSQTALVYGAFSTRIWEWVIEQPFSLETLPLLFTPASHAFLHLDSMHLMVNMGFLLAFGTATERRVGAGRFIAFYLLGAVAGALGVALSYLVTQEPAVVIGASGAVSALFGAWLRFDLGRRRRRPGRLPPSVVGLLAFVALNIFMALAFGAMGDLKIAWEAHLAGLFAGFALYPLFDRGFVAPPPSPPGDLPS